MIDTTITDADLREEHQRTGDTRPFERAMNDQAYMIGLRAGIKARRKQAARLSNANPANYHREPEAA